MRAGFPDGSGPFPLSEVGNIKAYTLAALYNAPATMGQYYASLVSRDLAEDSTDSIRARSAAPCLPMIV